jgi:hypothetical protein
MIMFKFFIFLLTCTCDNDLDTKDDCKTQLITEQPKLKIGKNLKNYEEEVSESPQEPKNCIKTLSDCYEYCYCCGFLCFSHIIDCFCCCRKCYQDK